MKSTADTVAAVLGLAAYAVFLVWAFFSLRSSRKWYKSHD